jgi:hypothetical protein
MLARLNLAGMVFWICGKQLVGDRQQARLGSSALSLVFQFLARSCKLMLIYALLALSLSTDQAEGVSHVFHCFDC